ncbi:MAG TPA: hypothetical protein PLZ43_15245 [bacterium]|nr:hypothetical protein [bacterium]
MDTSIEVIKKQAESQIQGYEAESEIVVDDLMTLEIATEIITKGQSYIKNIDDLFAEPAKKAHEAHKAITNLRESLKSPIMLKINALKAKCSLYLTDVEKKRKEEQAKAEAERLRLEAEERARLQDEADRLKAEGKTEEAEEKILEAETVVSVPEVVKAEVPKTVKTAFGSVTGKAEIVFNITNMAEFLNALCEKDLLEYIEIKEAKVKQYLKVNKIKEFPGLSITEIVQGNFRSKGVA